MLVHNLDPVLLSLGPFQIRYYSLVYVIGFLLAYFLLKREADRGGVQNLDPEGAELLTLYLMVGTILCARLFYVLVYNPAYYSANFLKAFAVWEGGLSFHGALIGLVAGLLLFCRQKKVSFYDLADVLVVPGALMLFFGRIANFINAELVGVVTTPEKTPWCFNFNQEVADGERVCRHPSQLYESLKNLLIFGSILFLKKYDSFKKTMGRGVFFWVFVTLYGLLRFLVTFYRALDPFDPGYLGLSLGQWLSLPMFLIGAVVLLRRWVVNR